MSSSSRSILLKIMAILALIGIVFGIVGTVWLSGSRPDVAQTISQ